MKKEDEDNNLSNSMLVARGRPYVTKNNEISKNVGNMESLRCK